MFHLHSERLRLLPLTIDHLQLLVQSRQILEKTLGINHGIFEVSAGKSFLDEFDTALEIFIIPSVKEHAARYEWYTHWLIVHRELNLTVGGIGFAGFPDNTGHTLIGYFTDRKFEGQGFATEAVSCLLDWAFRTPELKSVSAETLAENTASQRVLIKNGFARAGEGNEGLKWLKTRQ